MSKKQNLTVKPEKQLVLEMIIVFMGGEVTNTHSEDNGIWLSEDFTELTRQEQNAARQNLRDSKPGYFFTLKDTNYSTSWDWLIPAVAKLHSLVVDLVDDWGPLRRGFNRISDAIMDNDVKRAYAHFSYSLNYFLNVFTTTPAGFTLYCPTKKSLARKRV